MSSLLLVCIFHTRWCLQSLSCIYIALDRTTGQQLRFGFLKLLDYYRWAKSHDNHSKTRHKKHPKQLMFAFGLFGYCSLLDLTFRHLCKPFGAQIQIERRLAQLVDSDSHRGRLCQWPPTSTGLRNHEQRQHHPPLHLWLFHTWPLDEHQGTGNPNFTSGFCEEPIGSADICQGWSKKLAKFL